MNAWSLRNFLIRKPAPVLIRLTMPDGEQREVKASRSKARIAETIIAMGPDLIECLGKDGDVIRATRVEDTEVATRSANAPATPKEIQGDPQAAMLSHFANLIHRAYEHATDIAFGKFIELVERLDARTDAIESRLERTEAMWRREARERIDDLYDAAADAAERAAAGDSKDQIVQSLITGMMQGQAEAQRARAAANAKANGNGKG